MDQHPSLQDKLHEYSPHQGYQGQSERPGHLEERGIHNTQAGVVAENSQGKEHRRQSLRTSETIFSGCMVGQANTKSDSTFQKFHKEARRELSILATRLITLESGNNARAAVSITDGRKVSKL